jgi:hypothetical protein
MDRSSAVITHCLPRYGMRTMYSAKFPAYVGILHLLVTGCHKLPLTRVIIMKETKLPFCKYHALKCNDVEVKLHSFSASALDGFRWLASCSIRLNFSSDSSNFELRGNLCGICAIVNVFARIITLHFFLQYVRAVTIHMTLFA